MKTIYFRNQFIDPQVGETLIQVIKKALSESSLKDEEILIDMICIDNFYKKDTPQELLTREKFRKVMLCSVGGADDCVTVTVGKGNKTLDYDKRSFDKPISLLVSVCPFLPCIVTTGDMENHQEVIANTCLNMMTGKNNYGDVIFSSLEDLKEKADI